MVMEKSKVEFKSYVFYRSGVRKDYPVIVKGNGVYIYDNKGKEYIDIACGAGLANIGYGNEEVAEAMYKQATTHNFAESIKFTSEAQENLAKKIIDLSPKGMGKVWFCSGGAEANETALKMSRQYHLETGNPLKYKIISRWQSYHGNTIGALSMSGRTPWRKAYTPYLLNFPHISPSYCYHCPFGKTYPGCDIDCALDLERTIKQEGSEYVAAFIAETIVGGSSGVVIPVKEYWKIIRDICDKYNILLILDEVITCLGRTGEPFAINHWGIVPDIMTMAKGMAGSYAPLAGVICNQKIFDAFYEGSGEFNHGYTYSGHPVACAAGLAVQQYLEKHRLFERVVKIGAYFMEKLLTLNKIDIVGDIRGKGLLIGIEYVKDKKTRTPFERTKKVSEKITDAALKRGLVVLPGTCGVDGTVGDHNLMAPAFIITESEIDKAVDILEESILEVQGQLS
jgi:adenosylmethionine-8-amino-7-oxononanoate aminotransferase